MDQNVSIPNRLIPEIKQWVEDELEHALTDTAYRRDLATFYDRPTAAEVSAPGFDLEAKVAEVEP